MWYFLIKLICFFTATYKKLHAHQIVDDFELGMNLKKPKNISLFAVPFIVHPIFLDNILLNDIRIYHECEGRIEKSIPRFAV